MEKPGDYEVLAETLMVAARGLSATTMARIVNGLTPGINWQGCSKTHIAEGLAKEMDHPRLRHMAADESYTWRETIFGKLRDRLLEEKRPPTKKEREAKRLRERLSEERERELEADEWLKDGNALSDIDAQIEYQGDMIDQHVAQAREARSKRAKLIDIRATLEKRT